MSPRSMPVAANATSFPTWNVTVNDTNPLWFFVSGLLPTVHYPS